MTAILRFVLTTAFVLFVFCLIVSETAKEDAWSCLEERCCSIDFSKMLTTVDFVLYACGQKVDGDLTYSLYLDTGEEMDYIAYHPYQTLDETQYCGDICEKVIICAKSTTFKVTGDQDGTAEWCFEGNVDVENKTLYEDKNVCLSFYRNLVDIPQDLLTFLSDSNIW